ncbi:MULTISPECIES: hypothetical protein [Paracoccus]|uniref:UrcA family protein n=1 Tax=Paracoccus pantotrophus TaxID=82367 RepID=A0A7H9C130_PARPN|nr:MULTISPECIES: hypothetical protein [Paracoccus]KRW97011.1 hypothetical protein AQY21_06035 [Paracoccus sp. MKU1]MDF3855612.1 hypothetical protein [Paracoccus pantotrophus]MDF3906538.1 hypothetical protein [Paracoccus sp. AS002]QLH17062.1 hypothetical protein HYQ43_22845 [Paracoccus pantotrophus]SFP22278.1 hypothetical protein SAMN04244567_04028 [Paracoccus pantotrophus]
MHRLIPLLLMTGMTLLPSPGLAQSGSPNAVCLPPEEPYVPSDDDGFREYADVVSADFERYFRELTEYFACMDGTRFAVFERAREVSKAHQAFWLRANNLGVAEKAAANQPDAVEERRQ